MKSGPAFGAVLALLLAAGPFAGAITDDAASVRSAEIRENPWTERDFPRSRELAPGLYVYEPMFAPRTDLVFNTVSHGIVIDDAVSLEGTWRRARAKRSST